MLEQANQVLSPLEEGVQRVSSLIEEIANGNIPESVEVLSAVNLSVSNDITQRIMEKERELKELSDSAHKLNVSFSNMLSGPSK